MPQSHQLAAIMFTDIVGYTALMGKNSAEALELVRISKEIQKPLVEKHHGQWLKEMGDGVLMQFQSALSAVNCAVEIQAECRARLNAQLRIGIHLGEITVEKNDIYGDGINVASRLESIADPGGIYISEAVEKAITGLSNHETTKLGRRSFKNVGYPVTVYALHGTGLPEPKAKSKFGKRITTGIVIALIFVTGFYLGRSTTLDDSISRSGKYSIILPSDRPLEFIGSAPLNMGRPNIAISPDGKSIVYLSSVEGVPKLFKRAVDSYETVEIAGTDFAYNPIFSPDGKQVAFFSNGKLKVTSLNGTQGKELGSITNPYGMVWMPDGRIIVANNESSRLVSFNSEDINNSPGVTMISSSTYLWPSVIGDHTILAGSYDKDVRLVDLATRETTVLQGITSKYVKFLPAGYLLFVNQDDLFAVTFNANKKAITGTPVKVLDNFRMEDHFAPQLDVSANGTIVYAPGQPVTKANFVVLDRDGNEQELNIPAEHYGMFRYNPGTKQIATSTLWEQRDMLIIDVERGIRTPVRFNGNITHGLFVMSENDEDLYTVVHQREGNRLVRRSIITNETTVVYRNPALTGPYELNRDGDLLVTVYGASDSNTDIVVLNKGDSSSISEVAVTDAHEWGPSFSANGKFVAYTSDETGRYEVYMKEYPVTQRKWQISAAGGEEPIWINENKIIYRYQDVWYTVDIDWKGDVTQISKPVVAFSGNYVNPSGHSYAIWDEDHILVLKPKDTRTSSDQLNIMTNWLDELE